MPDDDKQLRSLIARSRAHRSWAQTGDRTARTAPARHAAELRFERQVDPDGVLPPQERARRAEHARKAFYLELSAASARARARRARQRSEDELLAAQLRRAADDLTDPP